MGKAIDDEVIEGYKETEIGVLPEEWEVVKLGEVAHVTAGGSAPQGDHFFGGKNPFIRVQHIDEVIGRISGWNLITDEAVSKYSLRLFPKGTIIFPKSGASIRLEKRAILPVDAYIVSHLCAVLPDVQMVHDIFLFHTLRSVRFAESKAEGYPTLSLSEIKATLIPLPPLPEQRKIAHVLSTIQRAIELQDKIIAAARELKKSLMRHLFTYGPVPVDQIDRVPLKETEIGPVPEHWEVVRLGKVISSGPQNGIYKPQHLYGEGTPIVRIDDFANDGQIITKAVPNRVSLSPDEIEKYCLKANDILINRVNSLSHLGKVALIGELNEKTVFESNMMRFSLDSNRVLPEYVFLILSSWICREQLKGKAKRAVAQSSINQTDVKTIVIPIPPLDEQKDIVRYIFLIEKQVTIQERRKMHLQSLRQTMLHLLMTGRVRVRDLEVNLDAPGR